MYVLADSELVRESFKTGSLGAVSHEAERLGNAGLGQRVRKTAQQSRL